MSEKSLSDYECKCTKYCPCELKARKKLHKESRSSSLRSRSSEKEHRSKSRDKNEKAKRKSEKHNKDSDSRGSRESKRKSKESKRGSESRSRRSKDSKSSVKSSATDSERSWHDDTYSENESVNYIGEISNSDGEDKSETKKEDSQDEAKEQKYDDHEETSKKSKSLDGEEKQSEDSRRSSRRSRSDKSKSSSDGKYNGSSSTSIGRIHPPFIKDSPRRSLSARSSRLDRIEEEVERITSKDESESKLHPKGTSSMVDFSASSAGVSVKTLRSSYWESSYSMHKDLLKAKEFIQKGYPVSLYDHLSEIVQKVVFNRINDSVDFIESISKDIKNERYLSQGDVYREVYQHPTNFCEMKRLNSLYKSLQVPKQIVLEEEEFVENDSSDMDENIIKTSLSTAERVSNIKEIMPIMPDFIQSNHYFKQAGFGLPEWEIFDLAVSVSRLVKNMKNIFSKIRFFGKIFGSHKQYYVLETEFTKEEVERCKRIQYENEKDIVTPEEEDQEEQLGEINSQENELVSDISHAELVKRITEKSDRIRREESLKRLETKQEESIKSSSRKSGESGLEGMTKNGSNSHRSGSKESETIKSQSIVTTASEKEEMVKEIIFDIIRGIMQCIAFDILKSVEAEMPCLPAEPVNTWTPPKDVPSEEIGEGLNRVVYWVCNNLENEWICLPNVSPKNIDIARKITVGFTGNLDAEVASFPKFEGKEKDYLRAQLARISSATSVSPMGYYVRGVEGEGDIDDDDDEIISAKYGEEEDFENYDYEDDGIDIRRNLHYKNKSMSQLANESLFYWVHHKKEITRDGRVTWWDDQKDEEMFDDDDGSEAEHTIITNTSRSGLPRPLFRPLSRETSWTKEQRNAWIVSKHACYMGGPNIVALNSLRWPGAVAYAAVDGKSDYMYVGWGLKFHPLGYRPMDLPTFETEFPMEDVVEDFDPSVTDEEDQLEEWQPRLRPRKSLTKQDCKELLQTLDEGEQDLMEAEASAIYMAPEEEISSESESKEESSGETVSISEE